jgi:hypothetical protein
VRVGGATGQPWGLTARERVGRAGVVDSTHIVLIGGTMYPNRGSHHFLIFLFFDPQ